jgi:hypothetical protein
MDQAQAVRHTAEWKSKWHAKSNDSRINPKGIDDRSIGNREWKSQIPSVVQIPEPSI